MITSPYNRVVMERNTDFDELVDLPREVRGEAFGAQLSRLRSWRSRSRRARPISAWSVRRARACASATRTCAAGLRALTARLSLNRVMISPADPELCERDPSAIVPHEVEQLLELVALGRRRYARQTAFGSTSPMRTARRSRSSPADPIVLHLGQRWFTGGSTLESTLRLAERAARRSGRRS